MSNRSQTIKLISLLTVLIAALGGGGYGGYQIKTHQIEDLQETNKIQDVALGKNLYRTTDLETDVLDLKDEIKELRKEVAQIYTQQQVMDGKLDILVEGYSGD